MVAAGSAFAAHCGLPIEAVADRPDLWAALLDPADFDRVMAEWMLACQHRGPWESVFRQWHAPKQGYVRVHLVAQPSVNENGVHIGYTGTVTIID